MNPNSPRTASGWLGVSGLSAPATATLQQASVQNTECYQPPLSQRSKVSAPKTDGNGNKEACKTKQNKRTKP